MISVESIKNSERSKVLYNNDGLVSSGESVVYVMSRDQRVSDNHALLFASDLADKFEKKFKVVFFLYPHLEPRIHQQYEFMLKGLSEVSADLGKLGIEMEILQGTFEDCFSQLNKSDELGAIVYDFVPYKKYIDQRSDIAKKFNIASYIVDTHNIIPCWITSDKEEYAARTIRRKIYKKVSDYLIEPDNTWLNNFKGKPIENTFEYDKYLNFINAPKVDNYKFPYLSGSKQAADMLEKFIANKIDDYSEDKNDPTKSALSNLSAYLHFGQVSSLRVALEILAIKKESDFPPQFGKPDSSVDVFLEEIIVRKELSDNYCYYNHNFNNINGAKEWAKETLSEHINDKREFHYTLKEFEGANTHEPAWNAAQRELVTTGKIHGYMRMYWAKKILEWSHTPSKAIETAIYLNDKYSIDGLDPNGYVGIMWSIAGVHDRPWFERDIYGKIRYMNSNGLKRKFNLEQYISNNQGK